MKTSNFNTNKASFSINGSKLIKEYYRLNDAIYADKEYELLKSIEKSYQSITINNWHYRALNVLDNPTKFSIEMEYINAGTMRDFYTATSNPKIYKHMGIWLGLLHECTMDKEKNTVLTFNDYSDTNLLVDIHKREIVAIDPGKYNNIRNHQSISIVVGVLSIQRTVIKINKSIPKAIISNYQFLKGYISTIENNKLPNIRQGLKYMSYRQRILWFRKKLSLRLNIIRTFEMAFITIQLKIFSNYFYLKSKFTGDLN